MPARTDGRRDLDALSEELQRLREPTVRHRDHAQHREPVPNIEWEPALTRDADEAIAERSRAGEVVLVIREPGRTPQRLREVVRLLRALHRDRGLEPPPPLGESTVEPPELPQRSGQAKGYVGLVAVACPPHRRAEVPEVRFESPVPRSLRRRAEVRLGRFGQREKVLRVPAREGVGLALVRGTFRGELADDVEHPIPRHVAVGRHERGQACVDESTDRGQSFVLPEIGDRAGGHDVPASVESRQGPEERAASRVEEPVAPRDRAAHRLLARRRISRAPGQDRKSMFEPVSKDGDG
jgi:hypothetical protein